MDFDDLKIDEYDEEKHKNFILDSWLKSARGGWFAKGSSKDDFFRVQESIIETLLKDAKCRVAKVDDTFLGYVVHDDTCLHYLYVKFAYRRQGIGKKLLDLGGDGLSHCSAITDEQWKRAWLHDRCGLDTSFYAALRYLIGREQAGPVFLFGT